MAIPGLGDLVEVACVHTFNGVDEMINVWHLHVAVAGSGSETDFSEDLITLFGGLYGNIEDEMSNKVDAQEIRWRNVTDDGPTIFVPWIGGGYNGGTGTADALPPGTTALILERTGTKGVQGKKYMPVFTEPTQDAGTLTPEAYTHLQDVADLLETQQPLLETAIEVTFHVYSRTLGNDFPITAGQARPQLAYQRRRRAGRGS